MKLTSYHKLTVYRFTSVLIFAWLISISVTAANVEKEFTYVQPGDQGHYVGANTVAEYNVAIKIEDPALVGLRVVGAKVDKFRHDEAQTDYKMWVSHELVANTPADIETVPTEENAGTIQVEFSQPALIPVEGIYVGYSVNVTKVTKYTSNPVPVMGAGGIKNSLYLQIQKDPWSDLSQLFGAATITVYLAGDALDTGVGVNKVILNSTLAELNKQGNVKFELVNMGSNKVTNVEYEYTLDNQTKTGSVSTNLNALGSTEIISVPVDGLNAPGFYPMTFKITRTNNEINNTTMQSAQARICVPEFNAYKRPLMEEYTGTWCGNCTRGWLGMKLLREKYTDFIGAAFHNGDIMTVTSDYPANATGLPCCTIDRGNIMDPFFGSSKSTELGIETDYLNACRTPGLADIEVATEWNKDSTALSVHSSVIFGGAMSTDYKIGYLLIQNGMEGDDPAWIQSNYYANRPEKGLLKAISEMPTLISDFEYEEVVVNSDACKGIKNSLPQELELSKTYTHDYTFATKRLLNLDGVDILQNRDNLYVIAMVINGVGEVANSVLVKAGQTVGIAKNACEYNDSEVLYYDLTGREVINPGHGIFIKKQGATCSKVKI